MKRAIVAVALVAVVSVACGSSRAPEQASLAEAPTPPVRDAGIEAPPPVRTMKTVGLLGGSSVHNLLIDPGFDDGDFGIGRWLSNSGGAIDGAGPPLSQVVTSSSPLGIALPVGAVGDETTSRSVTLLAQVPGGTGPFVVKLWVATQSPIPPGGKGVADLVRVSIASATGASLGGIDVPIDEAASRTIDGRTWTLFRGEVPGPFALGAFMLIRCKPSRNRWWLQAPEVVPKALAEPLPEAKSWSAPLVRRTLDADERRAIERYRKMPLDFGVGAPAR